MMEGMLVRSMNLNLKKNLDSYSNALHRTQFEQVRLRFEKQGEKAEHKLYLLELFKRQMG
jgi:hypothetical protein